MRDVAQDDERRTLLEREAEVRQQAVDDGVEAGYKQFEAELQASAVVVAVPAIIALQLVRDPKSVFANYETLVAAGLRGPANVVFDRHRRSVVGILFGTYGAHLRYGVLSISMDGLPTYGDLNCRLREVAVARRTTFLEENSYCFVKRHRLTADSRIPVGRRAGWDDRAALALAKLGGQLTSEQTADDRARLLVHSDGKNRDNDEFIEAHVYGAFNIESVAEMQMVPSDVRGEIDTLMAEAALEEFAKVLGRRDERRLRRQQGRKQQ